jgi:hypothetical protein
VRAPGAAVACALLRRTTRDDAHRGASRSMGIQDLTDEPRSTPSDDSAPHSQRLERSHWGLSSCRRPKSATTPTPHSGQTPQTGHALAPACVYRHATPMGRKSRAKRGRPQSPPTRPVERPRTRASRSPGARVARVAVDDVTWSAFRELCGETPASVRLGELVTAEVDRAARSEAAGTDPVTALRAIREQATVLDAYVRASLAQRSPEA